MKKLFCWLVAALAMFGLPSCSTEEVTTESIVGEWNVIDFGFMRSEHVDGSMAPLSSYMHGEYKSPNQPRVMSFNSDGTGLDDDSLWGTCVSFTWEFQGDKLILKAADQPYDNLPFEVQQKNNILSMQYDDMTENDGSMLGTRCSIRLKRDQ